MVTEYLVIEVVGIHGDKLLNVSHNLQNIKTLKREVLYSLSLSLSLSLSSLSLSPPSLFLHPTHPSSPFAPPLSFHSPHLFQCCTGEVWLQHDQSVLLFCHVSHISISLPVMEGNCCQVVECCVEIVSYVSCTSIKSVMI